MLLNGLEMVASQANLRRFRCQLSRFRLIDLLRRGGIAETQAAARAIRASAV